MRAARYMIVYHERPEYQGLVYELWAEMRPDLSRFPEPPTSRYWGRNKNNDPTPSIPMGVPGMTLHDRINQLREAGLLINEIGRIVSVHHTTVLRHLGLGRAKCKCRAWGRTKEATKWLTLISATAAASPLGASQ